MSFKPPFSIGEVVSNAVMTEAFKVGNMGGYAPFQDNRYPGPYQ